MEEIIQLTSDLIQFRTMHSNPKEIHNCSIFLENYLRQNGAKVKRIEVSGYPSIMVLPDSGFAPVLLMSHIDVVEAADELFTPYIKDGSLYGRGSVDDKYAVALSCYLIKIFLERQKQKGNNTHLLPFGILITSDEEIGGKKGAKVALQEIRSEFCIALDGGRLNEIVTKEKGIIKARLIMKGKSAHGSRPWLGENAIIKLMKDYEKIETLFPATAPDHWHRTINFSIVHAGKSFNQVPDYAEAVFDIRYTESDNVEEIIALMKKCTTGEIIIDGIEPVFSSGNSRYLQLLLETAEGASIGKEHGASDARYLCDYGIDGVVWGADGDYSLHSTTEHVIIESVYSLCRILDSFFTKVTALHCSTWERL